MAEVNRCRSGLHEIKSSQDRYPCGGCAGCGRLAQARYRDKRRAKLARLAAIEQALGM